MEGRWEVMWQMGDASEVQVVASPRPEPWRPNKASSLLGVATPLRCSRRCVQLLGDLITREQVAAWAPSSGLPCRLHAFLPDDEGCTGIGRGPGLWSPQPPGTAQPEISFV